MLRFQHAAQGLQAAERQGTKGESDSQAQGQVAAADEELYKLSPKRVLGGMCIGMIADLAAGYIGVDGGFIMVPLMTAPLGVPMRQASGTSLVAIIILAIPGVAEQIMYGNVDFVAGIAMAAGSILGAVVGARFVKELPKRTLHFVFTAFGTRHGPVPSKKPSTKN